MLPGAAIRQRIQVLSRNLSRWQDRYGVLFANPGISFIACRRDRGISCLGGRLFIQVYEVGKRQRRSVAVQAIPEPQIVLV